jgi:hypothetical protein
VAIFGKIGQPVRIQAPIYELDGVTRKAGVAADVDVQVLVGGVDAALASTVNEIATDAGPEYLVTFTPLVEGLHTVRIRYAPTMTDLGDEVQVWRHNFNDLAGFTVLPLARAAVDVGNAVELRVRFVLNDGTPFDPFELRQVVITNADTSAVLWTIGAAGIERLAEGEYRVWTPVALGESLTLADRWYFKGFNGSEQSRGFARVVAAVVGATDLLVTVERLKRHELGGVDLTDNDGNPLALETFEESIREATDELAARLDIKLAPEVVTEHHDYDLSRWSMFGWTEVDHRPLREVLKVEASYQGSGYVLPFPVEWINIVDPDFGQFNVVPQTGTLEQFLTMQAGNAVGSLMPVLHPGGSPWWPNLFHVTYRAGFDVGKVPPRIQKAIALKAGIEILNIAGEMIIGSGIASQSISIGGLSQSVSTTSSATNAGHGALIIQFTNQLKELIPAIRRQYHGVSFGVV